MTMQDSVRMAAEALLPDAPQLEETGSQETPMVVCGYTSEMLEEVLLPVCDAVSDCTRKATVLYPVAA